ncbi:MAG: Putative membrane protein, partial [Parcubacteria bacterium 33_209]
QKIIMILLALFAGTLGIHRFYAGKIGTGIIMLLLTLTIVGVYISGVWAIVDLVMIVCDKFKDGKGLIISK